MTHNHTHEFTNAMCNTNHGCTDAIKPDGNIHRFHIHGDKQGSLNGWYIFWGNAGVYGSWKTGEKLTWSSTGQYLSPEQQEKMRNKIAMLQIERSIQKRSMQMEAAKLAQKMWQEAAQADTNHKYLIAKHVQAHDLKQNGSALLVPLIDFYGTLWNLQKIYANSDKLFLPNGRVSGVFSLIGANNLNNLKRFFICEGWATGASLYEICKTPVLCAMNANNLVKVAQEARKHLPDANIIIAADNDRFTEGNPGLTQAIKAAQLINTMVMCLQFPDGAKGTDYNDAAQLGWRG